MEHVVKFNTLEQQLTDEEYSKFILKTLKSKSRKLFSDALSKEYEDRRYEIDELTDIAKSIIDARSTAEQQNKFKPPKSNKLDDMPPEIIAECASFLETNEYINFGNCNRGIYQSLYLPSAKIQQLSCREFNKYPEHLSMLKFKNIKSLSFFLTDLNKLSSENESIWKHSNNIETLKIVDNQMENETVDQLFNQFINDESVNLINIKSLTISGGRFSNIDSFFQFLSKFPNIQSIKLEDVESDDSESTILTEEHRKMLPHLKHFEFYAIDGMGERIAMLLNEQLRHISVMSIDSIADFPLFDVVPFTNLNKLELYGISNVEWMKAGFKLTSNLEVMHLSFATEDMEETEHINLMQTTFEEIINTQLSLKELNIMIQYSFEYDLVMNHLERALFLNRNVKRASNTLCIKFHMNIFREWTAKVVKNSIIVLNCMKLIRFLNEVFESIKIEFIIKSCPSDDETLNGTISELVKLGSNYIVNHRYNGESSTLNFSICNKEFVSNL